MTFRTLFVSPDLFRAFLDTCRQWGGCLLFQMPLCCLVVGEKCSCFCNCLNEFCLIKCPGKSIPVLPMVSNSVVFLFQFALLPVTQITKLTTLGSLCVSAEADKAAPSAGAANAEETVPLQAAASSSAVSGGEQTTLVHNEDEAFALEPLDITAVPGLGRCHSLPALKHQTNVCEILNGIFFPNFL